MLGSSGKVKIGNNVFIGMQTTILKGVHIGNNVIIGANSLVNKDIPDNCVAAGNPAHVIMSIDDYHKKRQSTQIQEAVELVREYRKVYGKEVSETELSEFFWLFTNVDEPLPECWDKKMKLVGNYDVSRRVLKDHEKSFPSLKEFLSYVCD